MNDELNNNNEQEELDDIVVLNDENGNEIKFEFLDLIELDGAEYVILLPLDDENSEEVVILKLENANDNEESYVTVEDDQILNRVFEIFREKFKDEFDFVD